MMKCVLNILLLWIYASTVAADSIKIGGSASAQDLLKDKIPNRISGFELFLEPSSCVKGLQDLRGNKLQMSFDLTAETFAHAAVAPSSIYVVSKLTQGQIIFFAHPHNTLTSLTYDQVKALFSGSLKNWSEVGGPDQEIQVVAEDETGELRQHLQLKDLSLSARTVKNSLEIPLKVAKAPYSIGYGFIETGSTPLWQHTVKELTLTGENTPQVVSITAISKSDTSVGIKALLNLL